MLLWRRRILSLLFGAILLSRQAPTESQKTLTSQSASFVKRTSQPGLVTSVICIHTSGINTRPSTQVYLRKDKIRVLQEATAAHKRPLQVYLKKNRKFDRSSREHKELTRSVTTCLAKDMLPLSTVDKPGFRAMILRLNPRYDLRTRSYFSRIAIPALYQEVRKGQV